LENFEMKKTLVAVAALVATGAFAQASITGVMDTAIATNDGTTTLGGGAFANTEVYFNASEDLGNGLKAEISYNITGTPQASTAASSPTSYNSFIGLSGDFGSLKLGNPITPFFFATTIADGTGRGGAGDDIIAGDGLVGLQVVQSVSYTSPSISGVSLSYLTTLAAGAGTTSYVLNYATGGFKAAYASIATSGNTDTLLAASYDFGMATLHYGNGTSDAGTNAKTNTIGVTVPFGALTAHAGLQQGDANSVSKYHLGYALSKRTTAYVLYTDNGSGGSDAATTYVGLKHAF
jgi:hypothetical protein